MSTTATATAPAARPLGASLRTSPALPLAFGLYVWNVHGGDRGLEYYTGYLVEKTLSVDNLFVFLIIISGFAVPREDQQKVLLFGITFAIIARSGMIALGAAASAATCS